MTCELRSLNHRYLEIGLKLPEGCKEWESDCRDRIHKKLSRGKIECLFQFIPNSQYSPTLTVNQGLIHQLIQATRQISNMPHIGDQSSGLSMIDLLNWPGVVNQEQMPTQQLKEPILSVLTMALDKLVAVREKKGQKLSNFLAEKLHISIEKLAKIKLFLPEVLVLKKQKLIDKLAGLKQEIDNHRLDKN